MALIFICTAITPEPRKQVVNVVESKHDRADWMLKFTHNQNTTPLLFRYTQPHDVWFVLMVDLKGSLLLRNCWRGCGGDVFDVCSRGTGGGMFVRRLSTRSDCWISHAGSFLYQTRAIAGLFGYDTHARAPHNDPGRFGGWWPCGAAWDERFCAATTERTRKCKHHTVDAIAG